MNNALGEWINDLRKKQNLPAVESITSEMNLKEDLGLDSIDLAVLAVRTLEKFKADIFAQGTVETVGDIEACLSARA